MKIKEIEENIEGETTRKIRKRIMSMKEGMRGKDEGTEERTPTKMTKNIIISEEKTVNMIKKKGRMIMTSMRKKTKKDMNLKNSLE
jgi:hypothetical protein